MAASLKQDGVPTAPTGNHLFDQALDCAEKLRNAICHQLGEKEDTTWEEILQKAGVAEEQAETAEGQKRFRESLYIYLESEASELGDKLEEFRFRITGDA